MELASISPEDFRIRASATGRIMADPKKGQLIPTGAITYLQDWYWEQTTGEEKFSGNKYTKKGWEVEDDAIKDYALFTGTKGISKNEDFFFNDFTEGTPDILVGDNLVVDIKCPWDLGNFLKYKSFNPTNKYPVPSAIYFWQLQSYMWLTGRSKAELAYVLKNTPKHLLGNYDEWDDYEGGLSILDRVAIFKVERSESHIKRIEQRVKDCREYLSLFILN